MRTQFAEADMRPLIQLPTWDGKLVLAGLFIIGYYSLVLIMAWRPLPSTNASLIRDAMLTLGPVVGLIFGSLFRTTGAEERREALRSSDFKAALETPAAPLAVDQVSDAVETGMTKALARAEPVEVTPKPPATSPLAADGRRRDWLDPVPAPPDPPSSVHAVAPGSTPVMED
jgi:hypothetical protein